MGLGPPKYTRPPLLSSRTCATVASESAETARAAEEEPPLLPPPLDDSAEANADAKGEMPVMGSGTTDACSAADIAAAVVSSGAEMKTSKSAEPMPILPPTAARVVTGTPGTAGVGGTYAARSDSEYQSRRREMRGAEAAGLIDMGCARPEPPGREKVRPAPPPLLPLRSRRTSIGAGGSLSSSSLREPPPSIWTCGSVTLTMMTSDAETIGAILLLELPTDELPPQLPLAHSASA